MIRLRLTLWNVAVLCACTTLLGFSIYRITIANLYAEVDSALRSQADLIIKLGDPEVKVPSPEGLTLKAGMSPFGPQGERLNKLQTALLVPRLFRPNLESAPIAGQIPKSDDVRELFQNPHLQVITRTIYEGSRLIRVSSRLFSDRAGNQYVVEVAQPLESTEREIARLGRLLVIIVPISWILAIGASLFLTDRVLNPVAKLADEATKLVGQDIVDRLPIVGQDEMSRLAMTFNRVLDRAETSYRQMERFTSDAAHELRSPLTSVMTRASAPLDESTTLERVKERMESIFNASEQMAKTLDGLLLLARLSQSGEHEPWAEVSLGIVTAEVLSKFEAVPRPSFEVSIDENVRVVGYEALIVIAITNLIANEVKYAGAEATVRVRVFSEGSCSCFEVSDDGPGVEDVHLPFLTDPFYRVEAARSHAEPDNSSGLGLAIVKAIMKAHQGAIDIQSSQQSGFRCLLRWPAVRRF